MMNYPITQKQITAYRQHLRQEERSPGTQEKYLRDVRSFAKWTAGATISKETVIQWKQYLSDQGYHPTTINSMLAALHSFFHFCGWSHCRVSYLRIQKRLFRDTERELTKREYTRLLETASHQGRERLCLLMETICATGIRVSEVKYITVEAAKRRRSDISLKGKIRTILLPGKLCRKLLQYAKKKKIASGEIFLTRNGTSLSRRQIWAELKSLCRAAGVEPSKVFPHNLRHLFAMTFYKACKDIIRLADILGHSSIETTRLYLITSGNEHRRQLDRLGLLL